MRSSFRLASALFALGAAAPAPDHKPWWKGAVVYEIYPRSYQDTNGDGAGDLNGITRRLGYLQNLGVNAIWIAPFYPSPQVDFGYDISDYRGVDPQYGTLADLDRLIAEAKKRNIHVLMDMVLNHTSDQHPWFKESASSRNNARADWYVWNDGLPANAPGVTPYQKRFVHEGRVPPNNWTSFFGGPAWEWVPSRHQYYYHIFYKQQPDLNWRNPAVKQAMFDAMRFWLDRGVSGFRLDAITTLYEDPKLTNETLTGGDTEYGDPRQTDVHKNNGPEVHDVLRDLRRMVDSYPGNRVLIGETYVPSTADLYRWSGGAQQDELHLPMDLLLGFGEGASYRAPHFRRYLSEIGTQLKGAQPLIVFNNHDQKRSWDRPGWGDGVHNLAIAKGLAAVFLTAPATALLYQGEELGMSTNTPARREDVKDPIGITGWPAEKGRDGERTPMQWTPGPNAGFTTGNPWLPVPASAASVNVESESNDRGSLLNWYKALIRLRETPAFAKGAIAFVDRGSPDVLAYVRKPASGPALLVVANMSASERSLDPDLAKAGLTGGTLRPLLSSAGARVEGGNIVSLPPYASIVAELR